jgi:hypothetical protein
LDANGFQLTDERGKGSTGSTTVKSKVAIGDTTITNNGITANKGTVGGCNINNNSITGGSTGKGKSNWSLNSDGTITCNNITASGGTIGGCTIDSNSISGKGWSFGANGISNIGAVYFNQGSITVAGTIFCNESIQCLSVVCGGQNLTASDIQKLHDL